MMRPTPLILLNKVDWAINRMLSSRISVKLRCPICNNEFRAKPSGKFYCSIKCYGKSIQVHIPKKCLRLPFKIVP